VDRPLPWLRYVAAGDLDDDVVDLDGMNVQSPTGEHLGAIDGFIVDAETARPYYVVVDSGGWFKSKHFLLPVGHARLDGEADALVAQIDRERIDRFPGFDRSEFEKLSEDDLKRYNDAICNACSTTGVVYTYSATEPYGRAWERPDYQMPDWWRSQPTHSGRRGAAGVTAGAETARAARTAPDSRHQIETAREQVVAREGDPSPHFAGRAQPGDVIGVETGGERTYVGDTAEDENKRRREAEEENAKHRK
jgi:hypothetical protein